MEFCVLSPITGLKRYSTLSKTHLLLPQLDKIQGYREFYLKMLQRGDFLILDNGAYEGQTDWQQLVECIKIYSPSVVALPDYMLQSWDKTYWEANRFLDRYYDQFPWVQWMFIPQAIPGDIIGWVTSLELAMRDPRIKWIGLARVLTYAITQDSLMRVNCAKTIHQMWPNIKMHALGMSKGSITELKALRDHTSVSSIDSNAPVWRGWNNWDLTEPVKYVHNQPPQFWPEIDINYQSEFPHLTVSKQRHELILHNLRVCGVNC